MNLERTGSGPFAYLAVHGWAGNSRTFRRLLPHLPSTASFYSMDLPGYGDTPAPEEYSMPLLANCVNAALESIDAGHITLLGHCGGALIAMEALRSGGPKVDRIVMIDPFAYVPWYFRIFTLGRFGRRAYLSTFANPIGRTLTNGALRRQRVGKTNLTKAFASVDHEVAYQYLCALCTLGNAGRFRGIDVPADIAYGERTFGAIRNSINTWRSILPELHIFELRGAGHEPIKEATQQLAEILFRDASEVNETLGNVPRAVATLDGS